MIAQRGGTRDRALEPGEGEMRFDAADQWARERHGAGVTVPRGAFDRGAARIAEPEQFRRLVERFARGIVDRGGEAAIDTNAADQQQLAMPARDEQQQIGEGEVGRSEEHTSELQSLMRISYAVFCLTKKNTNTIN